MLYPLRRGQLEQEPAVGLRVLSSRSNGASSSGEIDVVRNPCGEVLGGEQMRFVVLPVLAPALREGFLLGVLREPCDEVGMAGCDALPLESFSHFGDELEQSEAGIDEAIALARFLGKGGDIIARQVEQSLKTWEI